MDVLHDLDDIKDMAANTPSLRREINVVDPPDDLAEMLDLARFLQDHDAHGVLLGPDAEQIALPQPVYEALR